MRQLVINGPKVYPGATIVEYEDGHQTYLVYPELLDGPVLIAVHRTN
jgi:hypothetical protein